MGRRILAIFAATLIALVGVVSVLLYVRGADARAVEAQQPTTVYYAKSTVPAGTTLKDATRQGLIEQTTVAAKGAPTGALKAVDDTNSSLLALTDVQAGEFVTAARFGTTPVGEKAIEVPPGMVAVSVQLSDPARVGTFVTPGTHIAIFDSYKIRAIGDDSKAKALNEADVKGTSLLLHDVLVIGMGQTALNPGSAAGQDDAAAASAKEAQSFLVTVAVTPADAARLIHGINNGTLYAALRGSDLKLDKVPTVTDLNLFDVAGALK